LRKKRKREKERPLPSLQGEGGKGKIVRLHTVKGWEKCRKKKEKTKTARPLRRLNWKGKKKEKKKTTLKNKMNVGREERG